MVRDSVDSSMFVSIGFEPNTGTLEVEFVQGEIYEYFAVPEFIYRGLMLAGPKGAFFNRNIEGRYRYSKISDASKE